MEKILKRQKGKTEIIEVNSNKKETETIETEKKELEKVYEKMFSKVSNSYTAMEQDHGQFEFDKFDCLQETFTVIQEYITNGMSFDNLEFYANKVFSNMKKKYHRKFVKPLNSDCCFIEFNTDKMVMIDEKNPDNNYLEESTTKKRYYIKVIIKALKKKGDKKLFSLYHCREYTQDELIKKLDIKQSGISLKIKRLNHKIMGICQEFKINLLINENFAMPSWKHESLKGKWSQKYDVKPSISPDTKLDSQQNNRGISFETKPDFYDFENTGIDIPVKTKPINKTQKGKRNIDQDGFFSNCINQTRLMKLIDTKNLVYGSDIFNAFYSKKVLFKTD